MNVAQIESQALALPFDARSSLAHRLFLSLEDVSEPGFARLWGEESAQRVADANAGLVQEAPDQEVARKARIGALNKLKRRPTST